jgi:hypothetical protein
VIPEGACLVRNIEVVEEGVSFGDGTLGDEGRLKIVSMPWKMRAIRDTHTVSPGSTSLEETVPVLMKGMRDCSNLNYRVNIQCWSSGTLCCH